MLRWRATWRTPSPLWATTPFCIATFLRGVVRRSVGRVVTTTGNICIGRGVFEQGLLLTGTGFFLLFFVGFFSWFPFLSRRGRTGEWWSSLFGSTGEGNTRRYLDLMMGCWCFAVGTLGGYLEGGGFEELYLAVEAVGRAVPGRWRHRQDKKESRQNEMQLSLSVGVVFDCAWGEE